MKYLLIALISLVVAVFLGQFVADDPGFVVIGYGSKVLRTSFAVFAVLLIIGITAAYVLLRFLWGIVTIKTKWLNWRGEYRKKRSQRALNNGLIALAEGDFNRAEQLLSRGADDEASPAIHYIGAAEAAQAQNAGERRDTYLSRAREAMPSAEVAIGIKRAEMQISDAQFEQARATLDYLADRHPDNAQVLSLQHRTYKEIGDARALVNLLPALRRHRVFEPEELSSLEREAATTLMEDAYASIEDLNAVWHALAKSTREEPAVIAQYAQRLGWLGMHVEAEKLLRKSLARNWHADLIYQYGNVHIENRDLQLERAEGWLPARTEDADLMLCIAKLAISAQSWDKARATLQNLIEQAPSPMAYQLLAGVFEQAGEADAANRAHRDGLRLATNSVAGLPVPVSE